MGLCLMSIFHLIIIPEDIVVLLMYNILEMQVAHLMLMDCCCHLYVEIVLFCSTFVEFAEQNK